MFGPLTFSVAVCSVLISTCHAHLCPLTNLTAKWVDDITVNVSWTGPKSVPSNCSIKYVVRQENGTSVRDDKTHYLEVLLTEAASKWVFTVQMVGSPSCIGLDITEKQIVVEAPKPRALPTDFTCYTSQSDMDCSWISDPSSPVTISYRDCGTSLPLLQSGFQNCSQTFSHGQRRVCRIKGNFIQKDVCMVAASTNGKGKSTFRPRKVLTGLPDMTVLEDGTDLVLTLGSLKAHTDCSRYNICSSICSAAWKCEEYSTDNGAWKIPYEKSCQYRFQYRSQTTTLCSQIHSDWSDIIIYGVTVPSSAVSDWTVVAIVIPIIVAVCVILSCICFRRHKDIICPDVPDPSTIFKEMINGNKEIKPKVSMYTPVQEPIQPITVIVPPGGSGLAST